MRGGVRAALRLAPSPVLLVPAPRCSRRMIELAVPFLCGRLPLSAVCGCRIQQPTPPVRAFSWCTEAWFLQKRAATLDMSKIHFASSFRDEEPSL